MVALCIPDDAMSNKADGGKGSGPDDINSDTKRSDRTGDFSLSQHRDRLGWLIGTIDFPAVAY